MSVIINLLDRFKAKKELEEKASHDNALDEDYMHEALDTALNACEELSDDAIVILMIDGVMVSGATTNDKQLLLHLIALATEELEGLEE
jgi:hypothetical protein